MNLRPSGHEAIQCISERARLATRRQERIMGRAEALHGYLATLDPEQRAGFLAMAKERGFLRGLFGRHRQTRKR